MTRRLTAFLLVSAVLFALAIVDGPRHWAAAKGDKVIIKMKCENCDLEGSDFKDANIAYAKLAGANLSYSDMRGAFMLQSDLKGANLSYAMLDLAELTGVNLTGANLTGAILNGVHLSGATLINANLTGVRYTGSEFDALVGSLLGATWVDGACKCKDRTCTNCK